MHQAMTLFDRNLLRRRRDRVAAGGDVHGFLFQEVAERLAERLEDIRRSFPVALDLGCRRGLLSRVLSGRGGIDLLLQCDLSPAMARAAAAFGPALAADEELLPLRAQSLDLVLSNLSLHWANDLPGVLLQIRRALRPDGLFLGALFGGHTLQELREVLLEAEAALEGGASPRVSPFAELREAAALLQRAGFALPVADVDRITVTYPGALALMRELRGMGEANTLHTRRRSISRRATLLRAAALYAERFADAEGRLTATFEVLYLTGWAPHKSQQQPLKPGSAAACLATALGAEEVATGAKAKP